MKILLCLFGKDKLFSEISLFLPLVTQCIKNVQSGGEGKVKVQRLDDSTFHIFKLLEGIGVISNIDIIMHFGWIDFLILAGNPEAGNSNKLILMFGDIILASKLVQVNQGQM